MATLGRTLASIRGATQTVWERQYGRMHWRNNIIAVGDRLVFSTSGSVWNKPDEDDAVWCLEAETGNSLWKVGLKGDGNAVAVFDDCVLVGTDEGQLLALRLDNGELIAKHHVTTAVLTKATAIVHKGKRFAIFLSSTGLIIGYDLGIKEFRELGQLPFRVSSNPVVWGEDFFVGAGNDQLVRVKQRDFSFELVLSLPREPVGRYEVSPKGVQTLALAGDSLLVSFARDTYGNRPPLLCVDAATGALRWQGRGVKTLSKKHPQVFGNARTLPVVWRGMVITTFAYNDSVHAFDLRTGAGRWRIKLDEGFFQNWASAVALGRRLYVPRVNGVVSVINLETARLEKSLSIDVANPRTLDDAFDPAEALFHGISSSPIVADNRMYIGTIEGSLACVRLQ